VNVSTPAAYAKRAKIGIAPNDAADTRISPNPTHRRTVSSIADGACTVTVLLSVLLEG
jgi:hypothetical protein